MRQYLISLEDELKFLTNLCDSIIGLFLLQILSIMLSLDKISRGTVFRIRKCLDLLGSQLQNNNRTKCRNIWSNLEIKAVIETFLKASFRYQCSN